MLWNISPLSLEVSTPPTFIGEADFRLYSLFIHLSWCPHSCHLVPPLPRMSHGCRFLSFAITIVFVKLGVSLPQIVANTPSWLASAPSAPPNPPLGTQHHLHASMENSAPLRGSSTIRMRHQLLQPSLHSNSDSTRFFSGAWDFLGSLKIKLKFLHSIYIKTDHSTLLDFFYSLLFKHFLTTVFPFLLFSC